MSTLGTLHTVVHQSVWLFPAHTQGLVPSVFTHFLFCKRLTGSEVELIPTPAYRLYHSVCVCHLLSLLQCMTAPCRHSTVLQARVIGEDLILDKCRHSAMPKSSSWIRAVGGNKHGHNPHSLGCYGEMSCLVLASSPIISFFVLLRHDIDIVLSTPEPWTCL